LASAKLGHGSHIGAFNVVRDLREFVLDEGAAIGQWNWITASRDLASSLDAPASFMMGRQSALTSRHYVDASGGVKVGPFATVAGVRSTFITHGINVTESRQVVNGVEVGEFSMVGSNAKLTPGCCVPAYSLIGMGSVVVRGLSERYSLYAGAPARLVRAIPPESPYFSRDRGPVDVYRKEPAPFTTP
jgi:carbonic anhydrase/acetyltransferase-like protein (isoleucine patch superfamily)